MSTYITPQNELHVDYQGIALNCPNCQTMSHLTAVATPQFDELTRLKPKHIGVAFRCDACGEPVFLKFTPKTFGPAKIELAASYIEVERARENFPLSYLPEEAQSTVQGSPGLLCRRLFQRVRCDEQAHRAIAVPRTRRARKLELFDSLQEVRELAELDDGNFCGAAWGAVRQR